MDFSPKSKRRKQQVVTLVTTKKPTYKTSKSKPLKDKSQPKASKKEKAKPGVYSAGLHRITDRLRHNLQNVGETASLIQGRLIIKKDRQENVKTGLFASGKRSKMVSRLSPDSRAYFRSKARQDGDLLALLSSSSTTRKRPKFKISNKKHRMVDRNNILDQLEDNSRLEVQEDDEVSFNPIHSVFLTENSLTGKSNLASPFENDFTGISDDRSTPTIPPTGKANPSEIVRNLSKKDNSLAGRAVYVSRGNGLADKSEVFSRKNGFTNESARQEVDFLKQDDKVKTQKELMEILVQEMENLNHEFFPQIDLNKDLCKDLAKIFKQNHSGLSIQHYSFDEESTPKQTSTSNCHTKIITTPEFNRSKVRISQVGAPKKPRILKRSDTRHVTNTYDGITSENKVSLFCNPLDDVLNTSSASNPPNIFHERKVHYQTKSHRNVRQKMPDKVKCCDKFTNSELTRRSNDNRIPEFEKWATNLTEYGKTSTQSEHANLSERSKNMIDFKKTKTATNKESFCKISKLFDKIPRGSTNSSNLPYASELGVLNKRNLLQQDRQECRFENLR